jgi:hypothetical protein
MGEFSKFDSDCVISASLLDGGPIFKAFAGKRFNFQGFTLNWAAKGKSPQCGLPLSLGAPQR